MQSITAATRWIAHLLGVLTLSLSCAVGCAEEVPYRYLPVDDDFWELTINPNPVENFAYLATDQGTLDGWFASGGPLEPVDWSSEVVVLAIWGDCCSDGQFIPEVVDRVTTFGHTLTVHRPPNDGWTCTCPERIANPPRVYTGPGGCCFPPKALIAVPGEFADYRVRAN